MNNMAVLARQDKPFWTVEEIAAAVGLPLASTRVFCSRKVKSGELVGARRNLYLLPESLKNFEEQDLFALANLMQTPSYVSFTSALSFYGLTTQLSRDLVESANPVRVKQYKVGAISFRYYFCQPAYYFGFQKKNGVFIADPEKALLDCLYLVSFGRYALDRSALSLKNLQWNKIEKWLKRYPKRVTVLCKNLRETYENA